MQSAIDAFGGSAYGCTAMADLPRLPALRALALPLALPLALLASACGRGNGDALEMAIVGSSADLFEMGPRLSTGGQLVRAATVEGLVGLDAEGQVIPALADRWIVTDDGRSYIFRLRDGSWPDGSELSGERARDALRRVIRGLGGTSLGRDLTQIDEIRAMAGRVVEIRLKGPMPDFLQLLAQPELGLTRNGAGAGPMTLRRVGDTAVLSVMSPEQRGLPVTEGWQDKVRELRVDGLPAAEAFAQFDDGQVDVVLNGRIESLPLADTGPLSRGTVQIDPAIGLFGLLVTKADGFLGEASQREAVAMAIDRDALIARFNVSGLTPTTRIVAPGLASDLGTIGERWADMTQEQRRAAAAARVANWRRSKGVETVELSVALPKGPGADLLFQRLSADLTGIGITLKRVDLGQPASLTMIDRVARYASAQWFLNQFHCGLRGGICSREADARVTEALASSDADERAALLAEAEAELTQANGYIPFGQPVRFSLVRGRVTGFAANRWVFHPLPAFAVIPR